LQRVGRNDPGRHVGAEILAVERAEGAHFEALDVARCSLHQVSKTTLPR
jgi:hypothetical protein